MEPFREVFWNIDAYRFFYVLAAVAAAVFFIGLYMRLRVWKSGWKEKRGGNFEWRRVADRILLNTSIFRNDPLGGIMHVLIMWGFIILFLGTVLSTVDHWIFRYLEGDLYLVYAFILDIAGLALIAGILLAYLRRWFFKRERMVTIARDHVVLLLLLVSSATGFIVEGIRFGVDPPPWNEPSPAGIAFQKLFDFSEATSLSLHRFWWWIHALASLSIVAYFPFSKFIHVFAAPVNIALEGMGFDSFLTLEEREKLEADFSFHQIISLEACTQCNRCQVVCPSSIASEPLSPRRVVDEAAAFVRRKSGFGLLPWKGGDPGLSKAHADGNDQVWYCTTCGHCQAECPVAVSPMDIIREVRTARVESGEDVPPNIQEMLESVYKFKNPWQGSRGKRMDWAQGVEVQVFSEGANTTACYYVGCTVAYDNRLQDVARAAVRIFDSAGHDFAVLGKEEVCCSEFIRGVGEDGLFTELGFQNIDAFEKYGIERIITACPHGYHTFRNDYPRFGPSMKGKRVYHLSQIVEELIGSGKLHLEGAGETTVTYHDPCFLGRRNGIYDAPRNVLGAIPGITLVEMPRSKEWSLCCGGGGGRMWTESGADEKMAEIRVREAAATGAQVVVTACPFCFSNLDDAVKTAGFEERLAVKDLTELVSESLAGGSVE